MAIKLRYPDLDPAKDARLRSYLYQLIDELQYAFDREDELIEALNKEMEGVKKSKLSGRENISEEIFSAIAKANAFAKVVKELDDTVVLHGKLSTANGVWDYKKWKGGTYQMFGNFTVMPSESNAKGALFNTNPIIIPLPFEVTSACVCGNTTEGRMLSDCVLSGSKKDVSFIIVGGNTENMLSTAAVSLIVMGNYKK
jgi:hypothetical protein